MIDLITLDLYLKDYPLSFRASMLVEAASGGMVRAESLCKDTRALAVFRSMVAA